MTNIEVSNSEKFLHTSSSCNSKSDQLGKGRKRPLGRSYNSVMAEIVQECASNLEWQEVEVRSATRKGASYTVSIPPWAGTEDVTCECPSYVFRGSCRHTAQALEKICNWSSGGPVPQTDEQRHNRVCPRCGGQTYLVEE